MPSRHPLLHFQPMIEWAMVSSHHRQLVDGINTDADEYNYYAEPADEVKPEGKTILVLTIFVISCGD
jgi:hypothetical protein